MLCDVGADFPAVNGSLFLYVRDVRRNNDEIYPNFPQLVHRCKVVLQGILV